MPFVWLYSFDWFCEASGVVSISQGSCSVVDVESCCWTSAEKTEQKFLVALCWMFKLQ